MYAMQHSGEIGSRATTGIENADRRACKAKWLIEVNAEKMVHALDHVPDNLLWGVPHSKIFPKIRVECFKKRLVEVRNCFVFTEGFKEGRLNAVQSLACEVENLLKLNGIQRPRVGYFAKEFAKHGNAEIVSRYAPVETGSAR